jgi:tRNA1(Val) A37 N6-methylase TrmN6
MTAFPDNPPLLSIRQPERGYRFSIDSVLLAGFAAAFCRGAVLDLGTGCGVLLLLLSRLAGGMSSGTGVELQEELLSSARANFEENRLSGMLRAERGDFRGDVPAVEPGSFDLVISNPPFAVVGRGRRNADRGRETARHEVSCTLPELFAAAGRYLAPGGRFALILPVERLPDIEECARRAEMRAEFLRMVHPRAGDVARRVLYCASREGGDPPKTLPPLHVHGETEKYAPEVERICVLFRRGRQRRAV